MAKFGVRTPRVGDTVAIIGTRGFGRVTEVDSQRRLAVVVGNANGLEQAAEWKRLMFILVEKAEDEPADASAQAGPASGRRDQRGNRI
jgi:hypothetical protein